MKIIVKPCLSAASIDSWSRTDPPGWMIALISALAISSTLSANGKKASLLIKTWGLSTSMIPLFAISAMVETCIDIIY